MTANVRQAEPEDLSKIVRLHRSAFRTARTSKLGSRFTLRYYRELSSSPGLLLTAERSAEFAGFLLASPQKHYDDARRRLRSAAMLASLRSPTAAAHEIRQRLTTQGSKSGNSPAPRLDGPSLLLLNVAVVPEFQGQGVGKQLVGAFEAFAEAEGYRFGTTVVDRNNRNSRSLFGAAGWTATSDTTFGKSLAGNAS